MRRTRGFTGWYARVARGAIEHRWLVFGSTLLFLAGAAYLFTRLTPQFFPDDVQYWAYIDVWLPNNAALSETGETAARIERIVRQVTAQYGRRHPEPSRTRATSWSR